MNRTKRIAEIINAAPYTLNGTPCFWGIWFGRPYDCCYTLTHCEYEQDILKLYFDNNIIISIWSPSGLEMSIREFRIKNAERVHLEWSVSYRSNPSLKRHYRDYSKPDEEAAVLLPAFELA